MLSPQRGWQWSQTWRVLVCSAFAILVPLLLWAAWPDLLEPVELWTVDLRFKLRTPANPSDPQAPALVAIDYDNRAAHTHGLGRWPWDRRVHARLIDFLHAAGTRTVIMDFLFDHAARDPREDRALVEATRRAGAVFYPVALSPTAAGETEKATFPAPHHLIRGEVLGFGGLLSASHVTLPLPPLLQAARGSGHIQRATDKDGVLRRIPLVYAVKEGFVPALALSAAMHTLGIDPASVRIERARAIHLRAPDGKEIVVPIDAQGRAWINYSGPWGTSFVHYPYSWMLEEMRSNRDSLSARFKDTTVLVSNLITGSGSRVATTFDEDFPSGEVHLHLLRMLLTADFLQNARPFVILLCLVLPVALLTVASVTPGLLVILSSFLGILFTYLLVVQLTFRGGYLLPVMYPALALILGVVAHVAIRFFMVDRERQQFQSILGVFLPPQTLRMIQDSPMQVPRLLSGRSSELTILFVDIQGFTAYCKRTDPLQIQRVLRDYLTAMSVIVRAYGGTLDKYMGDGIMAFFGDAEPEEGGKEAEEGRVERQAANAVRAGLVMQKKMAGLNLHWVSKGLEPHTVRIGINTGVVTVGNLGTEYLWDYTVIGQEVNKAQRLQAAAAPGGLLLARRTYALAAKQGVLPQDLSARTITLKGIGEETALYSVHPELVTELAVDPLVEPLEPSPPPRRARILNLGIFRNRT
jgi:adenylate cyclase